MIDEPLAKVDRFVAVGADIITIHAESTQHVHRVLQSLGEMKNANDVTRGIVRGVALNPERRSRLSILCLRSWNWWCC